MERLRGEDEVVIGWGGYCALEFWIIYDVWRTRTSRCLDCHLVEGVWYIYDWDTRSSILI